MREAERVARVRRPAIRSPIRQHYLPVGCGVALVLLIAGAAALYWFSWVQFQWRLTVDQIQSMVDASGPAPHSSVAEVENWLDAHGIPNGEVPLDWREWNTPPAAPVVWGGPEAKQAQRVVMGSIWDAFDDPLLIGDVFILFYFDGNGQLFKTVVKGWNRGLP
jgi:hypothetical protein